MHINIITIINLCFWREKKQITARANSYSTTLFLVTTSQFSII